MPGHAPFALEEAVVLGYNVERLRKDQALTKTMFANMANISRPTLNKVENGEAVNIQLSRLCRIAEALNVTVVDLLTPPDDPSAVPIDIPYYLTPLDGLPAARKKHP